MQGLHPPSFGGYKSRPFLQAVNEMDPNLILAFLGPEKFGPRILFRHENHAGPKFLGAQKSPETR